jgi:hypothetical protein
MTLKLLLMLLLFESIIEPAHRGCSRAGAANFSSRCLDEGAENIPPKFEQTSRKLEQYFF